MKIIPRLSVIALTMITLSFSSASFAGKNDCQIAKQQLSAKAIRLERMAAQRKAKGDAYGHRRLNSLARVIRVHLSNLPCTSNKLCLH